ncbi:MAG: septal ring lytic transglycosylase RlpA family protein [Lamprobacter sp.]|uniref:septal ring lytic transglycosylase RlpA family protein n=1 Tax=Lamprobacter sp. TaxID=3100796 RepID=UPI002B258755|nr:septal ring lytic transglycosylase RlpA family protein [Lamprobacter sp.]MEA3640554.1 septal ring lytic transglycosylase RlpA family protein [Lamprobacter sp.]
MTNKFNLLLISLFLLASASSPLMAAKPGQVMTGVASYYHDSLHGNKTASGKIYNKHQLSAAHKTLPLGTRVRVTEPKSGRSVVLVVNDRGPFVKGRIIDLSRRAASELGMLKKGLTKVKVEILSVPGRSGA